MSCTDSTSELTYTGERVVPGKTPPFLVLEHRVRYRFAALFSDGLKVLDVGCGTGYGAAILAEKASLTVGVDRDRETIQYADKFYPRENLRYALADCRQLPFQDQFFGLAVSFEVIEHVREQDECLGEIRRVLSPDGILIVSTPNLVRSTKVIEEANPFHHKELSEGEFRELLRRHFSHVQLLYQHELSVSSIQPPDPRKNGPLKVVEDFSLTPPAKYFIAVCGARPVTVSRRWSLGVGGIEHQIAIIQDLRQLQKEVNALLHQREVHDREYARNLAAHRNEIDALVRQRDENEREYTRNLAAHRNEIDALVRQRDENDREYARNLAEQHRQIEALLHQREEIATAHQQVVAGLKMELGWLYRWIPMNKLARRFLYGRNLRKKFLARLRL